MNEHSDDDNEDALELIADVCADVCKGLDAIGKGDLSVKVRKAESAMRSASEAQRRLPEVLRAVGVVYKNSAVARLERLLRKKGVITDRSRGR